MKNKTFTLTIALALVAVGTLCGCHKEESALVFYLDGEGVETGAKVLVNGQGLRWYAGDKIRINSNEATVSAYSDGRAYITGVNRGNFYSAIYPSSIASASIGTPVTVRLPSTYTYTVANGYQKIDMPMAAYYNAEDNMDEESYSLYFRHLTSALVVHVTNSTSSTLYLDQVTVSSNKYSICGSRTIDMADLENSAAATIVGSDTTVTVAVNGAVTLTNGQSVDVVVPVAPVGSDNKFTVKVSTHRFTTTDKKRYFIFKKRQSSGGAVARNEVAYASAAMSFGSDYCYEDLPMEYVNGEYIITSAVDYLAFVDAVNSVASGPRGVNYRSENFKLAANINLQGNTVEPVEDFRGVFDGAGHTISNLNIATTDNVNVGMFGKYTQDKLFVKDLTVNGITLAYTGTSSTDVYMGGIVGNVSATASANKIQNCTVKNVKFVCPSGSGALYYGGIAGNVASANNTATFTSCKVNGVSVDNTARRSYSFGGIIGTHRSAIVLTNCTFTMPSSTALTSVSHFGGFFGYLANSVTFNNCTATIRLAHKGGNSGTVLGGIIGQVNGSNAKTITYNGCTASGSITVENSNVLGGGYVHADVGRVVTPSSVTYSGTATASVTISQAN